MNELPELLSGIGWQAARSTMVVAALLLLRQTLKNKVPAKWLYLVCVLGSIWFLVPITPPSLLSLWRCIPINDQSVDTEIKPGHSLVDPIQLVGNSSVIVPLRKPIAFPESNNQLPIIENKLKPGSTFSLIHWVALTWGGGTVLLLVAWITREIRTSFLIRTSERNKDPRLLQILSKSKSILHLQREVKLIKVASPRSPALTGLFRPAIVMGREFDSQFSDEQIEHIFLHELAHLKRGDLLTRVFLKIAFIFHWPNPVAWWLAKASHDDVEVATDAFVLQHLPGKDPHRSYGNTLLQVARSLSQSKQLLPGHLLGMAEPYQSNLETRIKMIANHNTLTKPKWTIVLTAIGATTISILLGFKPVTAQANLEKTGTPAALHPDDKTQRVFAIENKLRTIILPSIEFSGTKLTEALDVLEKLSKEHDKTGEGVNIKISEAVSAKRGAALITIRLSNVPLSEALRYTTNLAQTKYRIEPDGIEIRELTDNSELYTNLYTVPPTFSIRGDDSGDPFRAAGKPESPPARKPAKEILEEAGIIFGPGASAVYNPATSGLIVRNTQDQIELVEVYLESMKTGFEKLIHLEAKVFISNDPDTLVLPEMENLKTPREKQPLGIVRSFNDSKTMKEFLLSDSIEQQVAEAKDLQKRKEELGAENLRFQGILSPKQLETFLKKSKENPNVSLSALPVALVRSGQRGVIAGEAVAIGVDPLVGADNFTIDLRLMSRFLGKDLAELMNQASHQTTIWDGQSIVLTGKPDRKHHLLLIVTGRIVDPAGQPINRTSPGNRDSKLLKQISGGRERPDEDWQEKVRRADDLVLKASRLTRSDPSTAELHYREALKILPDRPETGQRQKSYLEQWFKVLKQIETETK